MNTDGRTSKVEGSCARRIAAATAFLVMVALGGGAAEPRFDAVVFEQGPVIDGVLDDEVWASASKVEGFVQFEPEFGKASPFRYLSRQIKNACSIRSK